MPFPQVLPTEGLFCCYSKGLEVLSCAPLQVQSCLCLSNFPLITHPRVGRAWFSWLPSPLKGLMPWAGLDHTLKGRTVLSRGYFWLFSLKNGAGRSDPASSVIKLTRAMWYPRFHLRPWSFSSNCPSGNSSSPPWIVADLHQNINSFTMLQVFLTREW